MHKIRIRDALWSLLRVFVGCAIAVFLLAALSVLVFPKNNQSAFGMPDEAANGILGERQNSIDVLFIGDSEAFSSFSPLQMWGEHGFTSYVCATSKQKLAYGNTLLHRATDAQRPRVVVFETNSVYASFTIDDAIMRTLQDVLPVLEFHDRWKSLSAQDLTTNITTTYTDALKGFRINRDVQPADDSNYMAPSDSVQPVPPINAFYLRSMVDYCRSIGACPLLVSTPSTVNWNMARHNGMTEFAQELGVEYVDLNVGSTKVDIDWQTETRDKGDHLNLTGATKVSAYMGDYLASTFALPDHRDDGAFSTWNEALTRYKTL